MIKKFRNINYGSYQDFIWDDNSLKDFKKLNILYGRNYSGKTTLSRILRSFEVKEPHDDYQEAKFKIELDEKNLTESNIRDENLNFPIRVYNKDFVRDNLKFLIDNDIESSIKAFPVVIGSKNIKIEEEIKELKQKLGNENNEENNIQNSGLYKELKDLEDKKNKIIEEKNRKNQDDKLRNKAKLIKENAEMYNNVTYNISYIKYDIKTIENTNSNQFKLTEKDKDSYKSILREEEKSEINLNFDFNKNNFINILNKSKNILKEEIITKKEIDNELRKWLEKGLEFHNDTENQQKCKFCDNLLSLNRIQWIIDNIKDDSLQKIKLENSLIEILENFEKNKLNIDNIFKIKYDNFYKIYRDEFAIYIEKLKEKIDIYNCELLNIQKYLIQKRDNIFKPIDIEENIYDYSQEISQILDSIKKLCNKNNEKTKTLNEDKSNARETLRLNEVAEFIENIDYYNVQNEIRKLEQDLNHIDEEINNKNQKIEEIKNKIKELEDSINDEINGAEQVNKYLKNFFGNNNLEFKTIPDEKGKFKVFRCGQEAKNLSEGECSLLAFCYFVAKLQDKETKDLKPIIWIDDPISSLDNNHVFFIFSLIDSQIAKNKNYKQLFIATHNLEFLRYLKNLNGFYMRGNKEKWTPMFLIEKKETSYIKEMPMHIQKYVTEFNYLFEKILECSEIKNPTEITIDTYYSIANDIRKFLDSFLFFKYPSNRNLIEKYTTFFGDYQKGSFVNRIINEFSHLDGNIDRSSIPLDLFEIQEVAKIIIDKIKEDDKQYKSFLESIDKDTKNANE